MSCYLSCLCLLLNLILILSPFCINTEFITQPVSFNTSLNSTVTFTCEATGVSFIFYYIGETPASDTISINRGFTELGQDTINGTVRRRRLSVYAQEINNNSIIHCFAVPGDIRSNNATLTIQGLLASVVDLDYTFINGSSVLLTWTAPYTLDNVPITGYYIVNGSVNITTTNNNTNITLSATNPNPCVLNNVSVSPINDVGIGSSNIINFYHERVSFITPPVSVVPIIDGQQISLNIYINVSTICKREHPNSITVTILNTDNSVINNTSIPVQVNDDQLVITGVITVPNNLNTFIVNVSLSINGREYLLMPSFGFGKVGSVTNIDSSINNCSTINITWTAPTVDDRVSIQYYILRIYDAITGGLVDTVSVYDTSYQFVNNNLFIHRYTYVITGVNELGEGISSNDTFSYQRVPRSVEEAGSKIITYDGTSNTASYNIPVTLECTGEAPENITITIQCNETGVVLNETYLVEYAKQPMNITGSVPVPLYQQCTISIVFSNEAGSTESFILAIDTEYSTPSPTTGTSETATSPPDPISGTAPSAIIGATVSGTSVVIIVLIIIIILTVIKVKMPCKQEHEQQNQLEVPTTDEPNSTITGAAADGTINFDSDKESEASFYSLYSTTV